MISPARLDGYRCPYPNGKRTAYGYRNLDNFRLRILARGKFSPVNYPTASCGALREMELPHPKVRTGPLSSPQQAGGYSPVTGVFTGDSYKARKKMLSYEGHRNR